MTDEPQNLSSACITRAKVTMPAPSPYSLLSSLDLCRRKASWSQTSSRRPVQSLGGCRCGFSNNRKVSVPSSGSPGVVFVGIGTGEVVGATASGVGAQVIGGVYGKDQGTMLLVPKYQQKVHELNIQSASLDQLLSLKLSLRAGAQHDTIQYRTENFPENTATLELKYNTQCNEYNTNMSTQILRSIPIVLRIQIQAHTKGSKLPAFGKAITKGCLVTAFKNGRVSS